MSIKAGKDKLGLARRRGKTTNTKLNLVSLMDIFTILVFFLMLNSGDVEVLQPDEKIELPKSFATLKPDNAPVIKLNNDSLYFKEEKIIGTQSILKINEEDVIAPLMTALKEYKGNDTVSGEGDSLSGKKAISMMSDTQVPYAIVKRVLYTCAQAGFRDIALAVEYSTKTLANATTDASANTSFTEAKGG